MGIMEGRDVESIKQKYRKYRTLLLCFALLLMLVVRPYIWPFVLLLLFDR